LSVTATDLFCGAGGSSLGAELAGVTLRLGVNHWERAIETHATNFQHADHDCTDVSSLTTAQIRRYPDTDILLASPECTNHSLAKGALRRKPQPPSLFDDGPAGDDEQDRSRATMWDVVRFAEQKILKGKPYRAIVVENVVDAFKWGYNDDGGLFRAWRDALHALGYTSEIVYLNSMFAPPTPQSRDRMYVVFWRKGARRPNLRFEPVSWCPRCEAVVLGRQIWKKPTRPWGRYGAQYFYGCPDCHETVFPGVFPAASAIDWELPAQRIGDRAKPLAKNTRERIRRGLNRLSSEPFALRLLHGTAPRPLTLPLVTLTRRHDMAMVLPTAAGTFERTPGNRARDPQTRPFDTVHGTFHQGLVVPAGGSRRRDGKGTREPHPTQTQSESSALVMANTENNVPRPADRAPTQTLRTEGGLGVVQVQRNGGVKPPHEPVHTVRAGGFHHGVLVAHYDPGWARRSELEPFGSLTTRDSHTLVVPYQSEPHAVDPTKTVTTHDRLALAVPPTLPEDYELPSVEWSDDEIDDCRFRMFDLHEIARVMQMHAHTSGGEYVVVGNKRERMAQYGNAVTPPVMQLITERLLEVIG
jgi:DNA (cytosine-5)-methyltransferase 1